MSKSEITPYRIEEVRTVSNGVVCKAWKVIGLHAPQEVFRTKAKAKAWIESDTPPDRKHTPLPWKALEGVSSNGMISPDAATAIIADNEDGWDIAAVWTDLPGMNGAENPKFIALACNSHYKLVEALRECITDDHATHRGPGRLRYITEIARAALAAAE